MIAKSYLRSIIVFMLACVSLNAQAGDENTNVLSSRISKAHNSGVEFAGVQLFTNIQAAKHAELNSEQALAPVTGNIKAIYQQRPGAVAIKFTTAEGKEYTLEMMESHPFSADVEMGYIDATGRHTATFDKGLHYQGAIKGMPHSFAAMSVFATGKVMVLFANDEGNFVVGELEDGSGNYILYNDQDMKYRPTHPCGTTDEMAVAPGKRAAGKTTAAQICKKARIYWETDFAIFQDKGNLTATQNYFTGLFNQIQALYLNDNIGIELSAMYNWVSQDFFQDGTSADALYHFRAYWNALGNSFNGDYAQLLAKDPGGNGGISFLDIMCYRPSAYGYNDIHGSYNTIPTYSWDVSATSHEAGHAFGSKHTHWCGWNTGPGNSCGAIDNCYTLENGSSCSTCPVQYNKSNTNWKGTIMSYCHLVSGKGVDLANGFGPLPGDFIRNNLSTSSCLSSVISATLTPADICNNDGSVTLAFNPDNRAVSPYTFSWSNSAKTQDINSLGNAGNYTVTIKDSNNCQIQLTANVQKMAAPGDGKAVLLPLPLCCKDTSFVFTLAANVPSDLSNCQTVAWLRTSAAITSYNDAQTAFNNAGAGDIIEATNATSVNTSTAATLDIQSPNPCSGKSGYYYTPFVTRKAKTAKNINGGVSTSIDIKQNNTIIGKAALIPDQMSQVTTCDRLETPTQSLAVNITGYTGRSNKMTLIVTDDNDEQIYFQENAPGNGNYNIPLTNVDNPLQAMTVIAVDYNCSDVSTCVGSTVTIAATRTVTYPAVSQVTFDKSCVVGQSIMLTFAPDSCHSLDVATINGEINSDIKLYPNPASSTTTLEFEANDNGTAFISITDVTGRVADKRMVNYYAGKNTIPLNVRNWARGVYFLTVTSGNDTRTNIKMVLE